MKQNLKIFLSNFEIGLRLLLDRIFVYVLKKIDKFLLIVKTSKKG